MNTEIKRRKPRPGKNLIKKRFGRLLCIRQHGYKGYHRLWWCRCDCGNELPVLATNLIRGSTKSCGCMNRRGKNCWNWEGYEDISGKRWLVMKTSAKNRGIEFSVTREYCWELFKSQNGKCKLSDVPIWLINHETGKEGPASLDRIDSSKGYVEGNVQWVHKDVNYMKRNYDQSYFVNLCRLIANKNS